MINERFLIPTLKETSGIICVVCKLDVRLAVLERVPEISLLYHELWSMDISPYLRTNRFTALLIRKEIDEEWRYCTDIVGQPCDGLTNQTIHPLEWFIAGLLHKHPKTFLTLLKNILHDFCRYSGSTKDYRKIRKLLQKVGFTWSDIEDVRCSGPLSNNTINQERKPDHVTPLQETDERSVLSKSSRPLCVVILSSVHGDLKLYNILRQIVTEKGYSCLQSKDELSEITYIIRQAQLVIVDLTNHDPVVFYGLGIADALHKQVIVLSQEETIEPLSEQRLFLQYNLDDLKTDFTQKLMTMLSHFENMY